MNTINNITNRNETTQHVENKEAGNSTIHDTTEKDIDKIKKSSKPEDRGKPSIPSPSGSYSLAGALDTLGSFEDLALLFHEVAKKARVSQRQESYTLQQNIVSTLNDAAMKKDEAAGKMMMGAGMSLGFSIASVAVDIAVNVFSCVVAALSAVKAVGQTPQAVAKDVAKDVMKGITDTVKEVVEETVKETVEETIKETVEETVKETVEETVKETVEETVKETVEETVKGTVEETVQKGTKDTTEKGLEKSVEHILEETYKKAYDELKGKFPHNICHDLATKATQRMGGKLKDSLVNADDPVQWLRDFKPDDMMNDAISGTLKDFMKPGKLGKNQAKITTFFKAGWDKLCNNLTDPKNLSSLKQVTESTGQSLNQTSQASSKKTEAEADRIQAEASKGQSQKQRTDDLERDLNETMKTIRSKLSEMQAAKQKAMDAASRI